MTGVESGTIFFPTVTPAKAGAQLLCSSLKSTNAGFRLARDISLRSIKARVRNDGG